MVTSRTHDRHSPDNLKITIRARREWIARLDSAAKAAGESRMAYIRKAVEERMQREGVENPDRAKP